MCVNIVALHNAHGRCGTTLTTAGGTMKWSPPSTADHQWVCASTCFRQCESTQSHRPGAGTQLAQTADGHPGLLQRTLPPRAGTWRAPEISQRMDIGGLLVGKRFACVVLCDIVGRDNDTFFPSPVELRHFVHDLTGVVGADSENDGAVTRCGVASSCRTVLKLKNPFSAKLHF